MRILKKERLAWMGVSNAIANYQTQDNFCNINYFKSLVVFAYFQMDPFETFELTNILSRILPNPTLGAVPFAPQQCSQYQVPLPAYVVDGDEYTGGFTKPPPLLPMHRVQAPFRRGVGALPPWLVCPATLAHPQQLLPMFPRTFLARPPLTTPSIRLPDSSPKKRFTFSVLLSTWRGSSASRTPAQLFTETNGGTIHSRQATAGDGFDILGPSN